MVCPPATSEAGARWPRFGLIVVATTSRRDNKVQMIRPIELLHVLTTKWFQFPFLIIIKQIYLKIAIFIQLYGPPYF
jgi:hypothetical protein